MAGAIVAEASLSFLGLGAPAPLPSGGAMIEEGRPFMLVAPHLVLAPGIALAATVLALQLIGDGLRDLLDVRHQAGRRPRAVSALAARAVAGRATDDHAGADRAAAAPAGLTGAVVDAVTELEPAGTPETVAVVGDRRAPAPDRGGEHGARRAHDPGAVDAG